MKPIQHSASRRVRPARSIGWNDSLATAGSYTLQGKSHSKWNEPEQHARYCVVVARIAHVQKPQKLLVDEKEPEEPVIFARRAAHREVEPGRVVERRQDVPRRRDHADDQQSAERVQAFPDVALETIDALGRDRVIRRRRETTCQPSFSAAARRPGSRPARTPKVGDAARPRPGPAGRPTSRAQSSRSA